MHTQSGSLLLEPLVCAPIALQPCLWGTCPALLSYRQQEKGPEASCRPGKEDLTVPEDNWLHLHALSMGLMSVSTPGCAELYGRDPPLPALSSFVQGAAGREPDCCEELGGFVTEMKRLEQESVTSRS